MSDLEGYSVSICADDSAGGVEYVRRSAVNGGVQLAYVASNSF
jgi:hypothetical protein